MMWWILCMRTSCNSRTRNLCWAENFSQPKTKSKDSDKRMGQKRSITILNRCAKIRSSRICKRYSRWFSRELFRRFSIRYKHEHRVLWTISDVLRNFQTLSLLKLTQWRLVLASRLTSKLTLQITWEILQAACHKVIQRETVFWKRFMGDAVPRRLDTVCRRVTKTRQ